MSVVGASDCEFKALSLTSTGKPNEIIWLNFCFCNANRLLYRIVNLKHMFDKRFSPWHKFDKFLSSCVSR